VPSASPFEPHNASYREERGLFERSTAARTFGSLGIFLVLILLGAGIYLLQQALTDPLGAESMSILAGAFILAIAAAMIGLLFTPSKKGLVTATRRIREAQYEPTSIPRNLQHHPTITAASPKVVAAQSELRRI